MSSSPFLLLKRKVKFPGSINTAEIEASVAANEGGVSNSDDDIRILKVIQNTEERKRSSNYDDDEIVEIDILTGAKKPIIAKRTRRAEISDITEITFLGSTSASTGTETGTGTAAGTSTSRRGRRKNSDRLLQRASNAVADMITALAPQSIELIRSRTGNSDEYIMENEGAISSSRLFRNQQQQPHFPPLAQAVKSSPVKPLRNAKILDALEKQKALLPPDNGQPPAQFKCSVCLEIASESTVVCTTNCGHLFCEDCLNSIWSMPGTKKCPNCRKPISKKGSHRLYLSA